MSAETLTFKVAHLLGARPADLPDGEVFVAPRPLYGTAVRIDGLTNWAGLVVVRKVDDSEHGDARRRWEELSYNHRMDAQLIVWTERAEAIRVARYYLTAEYGAADVAGLTDADLLDTWRYNACTPKQVTVTGFPDPTHPTHRFEDWTA